MVVASFVVVDPLLLVVAIQLGALDLAEDRGAVDKIYFFKKDQEIIKKKETIKKYF